MYFAWFGELDPKSRLFLIYLPNAINQKPIMAGFWFFVLLYIKTFKNSYYCFIKIKKGLGLVFRLRSRANDESEIFVISCTNF